MLFPVIEEINSFSFSFEHFNIKKISNANISTFGLNKCSNIQYNISSDKIREKIITYLKNDNYL
jgi:hypothetical protein